MAIPALLTSPPRPLSLTTRCTASTDRAIDGSSVTSSVMGMSDGPPFAASASPARGSRTPANTVIPRPAQSSAQAAPMPVEAPVITKDIWLIWLGSFNQENQTNQINQTDQMNQTDRLVSASCQVRVPWHDAGEQPPH